MPMAGRGGFVVPLIPLLLELVEPTSLLSEPVNPIGSYQLVFPSARLK